MRGQHSEVLDKLQKEPVTGDEIIMWPAPFVNGITDILSPLMK